MELVTASLPNMDKDKFCVCGVVHAASSVLTTDRCRQWDSYNHSQLYITAGSSCEERKHITFVRAETCACTNVSRWEYKSLLFDVNHIVTLY